MKVLATTLTIALGLGACASHDIVVGDLREVVDFPATPNPDLDILFVIDNSPSMGDKQASLAANFPRIIDTLSTLDTGLPNLHIGVVTSDMGTSSSGDLEPAAPLDPGGPGGCGGNGDDGVLQHANAMGLDAAFISDIANPDGTRTRNYTGALRDVFSEIALVGQNGCGFEQHLRAMQRGLTNPVNQDFLRPSANLAVVIVADEDDCSATHGTLFTTDTSELGPLESYRCTKYGVVCDPDDPDSPHDDLANCRVRSDSPYIDDVQPYADALVALKGDPRMVMVANVVGDAQPFATVLADNGTGVALAHSCTFSEPDGQMGVADPAVRLAAFADAFPGRETTTSICNADLSGALVQIGSTAKQLVGDRCLASTTGLADISDDPGLQPACETQDVRDSDPSAPTELPLCAGTSATDCYEFVADATACPVTPDHLKVNVRRSHAAAADTWTHVRCQLSVP